MWDKLASISAGVLGWIGRKAIGASRAMSETTGLPWPPEEHQPRLRRYARNYDLFRGRHEKVFVGGYKGEGETFRFAYDDTVEYIAVNFLGRLTRMLASRLFGEGVRITAPEDRQETQQFIDELYRNQRLEHLNMLAAQGASYRGDALYKVWYDAEQRAIRIGTILPSIWFPEKDSLDQSRISAHVIGQILRGPDGDPDHYYLWLERHEMRSGTSWISHTIYQASKGENGAFRYHPDKEVSPDIWRQWPKFANMEPEVNTGIDAFLIVHVPNVQTEETSFWGVSDYDELLTLQAELNNRMTQRQDVLDKFVDPVFVGPANAAVIDPDSPSAVPSVNLADMKYIDMPPDGKMPAGYLTWDASLSAVENEIRELVNSIAAVAGVDVQALKPMESIGPTSGRALKLGQMNTQTTVSGKHMTFGPALEELFSVATKLANARGVVLDGPKPEPLEPQQLNVQFSDGLPQDDIEDAQYQGERIAAGTQHPVDAIMQLDRLTRDQAEEKWQRILEMQGTATGLPTGLPALNLGFNTPDTGAQ